MDETIQVSDAVKGEELKVLVGYSSCVNGITFSPDSLLLASGSTDQMVRLWDVTKGEMRLLLDGHSGHVNSVAYRLTESKLYLDQMI